MARTLLSSRHLSPPCFQPKGSSSLSPILSYSPCHDGGVDPIRLYVCVLSAYRGMSQCAIALSFSYIGLGWVFENYGTSDVTGSSALIA